MIAASLRVPGKGRGEYEMLLEDFINVLRFFNKSVLTFT